MDRAELEALDRESLVVKAQEAGIRRARILTRPELVDELLRLDPRADEASLKRSRGFFGVARDLLARVVERGLHLPDAADRIRTSILPPPAASRVEPQAVPTVTLAEIYAAQGHPSRAVETLERLLEDEPEHGAARALLAKLTAASYVPPPPPLPPEPEVEEAPKPEPSERDVAAAEHEGDEGEVDEAEEAEGADELEEEDADEELAAAAQDDEELAAGDATDDADTIALGGPRFDDDVTVAMTGPLPPLGDEDAVTRALAPACVVLPLGPRRAFVWWRSGVLRADAPFVVRVLVVAPSWDGPQSLVRDFEVDPTTGELTLEDLPSLSVVRAAIGFGRGESFTPAAHAPLLEAAPRFTAGPSGLLRWTASGMRPVSLEDPASRPILDALRRVRAASAG